MAHAALVYLMQLLETEMIQFSFRVLEIEEEKARSFLLKADEVLSKLSEFENLKNVPDSDVMQMRKGSEPLALPINEDFVNAARSPRVQLDCRPIMIKIPGILFQLYQGYFDTSMLIYRLDNEVVSHPAPNLIQQQELLHDLLAANEEFVRIIVFFNGLIKKAEAPYSIAGRLLEDIELFDLRGVNLVKIAAEEAAKSIEDMLTVVGIHLLGKENFMEDSSFHDLAGRIDHTLEGTFDHLKGLDRFLFASFIPQCRTYGYICPEPEVLTSDLDDDVNNMIDELTRQSDGLEILQVSEMGNTGKPTLAEKVFRHQTVVLWFECLARIGSISSIDQVLSHLLYFIAPSSGGIQDKNRDDKGKQLYRSLEGRKYLVVLHGLQNLEIWEAIQKYFPDDGVGSRIIVSSVLNTESSQGSSLVNEDIVVSLDEDIRKIIDELTRPPSRLSIVTITGMGGIGKSTLAKNVFHHPMIVHHFHSIAWISTVASIDQVLSHLLQVIAPSRNGIQAQSIEDKGQLLYKSLKGRKYLIAVDGLWNFEVWDAVQRYLPDDNVASRILITTRVVDFLPSTNILKNPPHCISPLDKHQSWELLEKLVFGQKSCPVELAAVGKEIAEKCGGLPLAIVVIAGILIGIQKSYSSWLSINTAVTSAVSADAKQCVDILALSYKYLPSHLKTCFLYMGAFPANHQIEVEKLLNLWIATGFLSSNSSKHEAEKYLKDLIDRNLVRAGKRSVDGKVKTCLIHDLVRQVCLREAREENFMQVIESNAIANGLEKPRHLVFTLEDLDDFQLLPSLPNLQSFVWMNLGSDFTPGMILLQLSAFKRLRVLDIYFVPFDTFPSELLNLVNLRYLALNVTYDLDASISQLFKLQTLLIYGPWVSGKGDGIPTLFVEFWKMPWLRNIYVKVPSCLRYPYPLQPLLDGLRAPSNLQSLSKIAVSSCREEVFLLMPNLKKLGVSETKEDFEKGELTMCFRNLTLLTELETLKCSFYKGNREVRSLDCYFLPESLTKLTLDGSHISWDEMKFLALLPRLETLKLKNYAFEGPSWVVTENEVFGSLKHLLIDNTNLVNWEVETTNNFPRLRLLVLRSCQLLEEIPCGVGELSVLEVIELHHCSESAKNSAREFEDQYGLPKVVTGSYW